MIMVVVALQSIETCEVTGDSVEKDPVSRQFVDCSSEIVEQRIIEPSNGSQYLG